MDKELEKFEDLRLNQRLPAKAQYQTVFEQAKWDHRHITDGVEQMQAAWGVPGVAKAWDKVARLDTKINEVATQYYLSHPEAFADLEALSLEELVKSLGRARASWEASGGEFGSERCILIEIILEAKFEKQGKGVRGTGVLRIPSRGSARG